MTIKSRLSVEEYVNGILSGNRVVLSRAITLLESALPADRLLADEVMNKVLPNSGKSLRIGITGVPGVGKSTFIEAFGNLITQKGKKVAVLAIDPSSQKTKGSILGDKTRMESLSVNPMAYIRPTPSGSVLGGVANRTRETMLFCEAAGFEVIIIETVGVGQSETAVKGMTDFFLLLMLAGAGDELQGIKKGIMEMADALVINKADGDNIQQAKRAASEYENALQLFHPEYNFWYPKVSTCSALHNLDIETIWNTILDFEAKSKEHHYFFTNRQNQNLQWFNNSLLEELKYKFYTNETILSALPEIEQKIKENALSPSAAAKELIKKIF